MASALLQKYLHRSVAGKLLVSQLAKSALRHPDLALVAQLKNEAPQSCRGCS